MKRIAKNICLLFLLCACVCACFGCGISREEKLMFDTELFRCIYNEEKTEVTILELTEKGAQQEILVIPETINGLPVVQLGGATKGYPYQQWHYIKSDVVKKVYVDNSNYISMRLVYFSQPVDVIIMRNNSFARMVSAEHHIHNASRCYTTDDILNCNREMIAEKPNAKDFLKIEEVNLYFIDISSENKLIWMDHIEDDGIYYCPYFKQNWYIDEQCTILWDKDYEKLLSLGIKKIYTGESK